MSTSGHAHPNKDHHRATIGIQKANKFLGKKCDKKVKTFTDKEAMIKATSKDQLNTITAIDSKALEQTQDPIKHRHQQLQRLQNWCMDRISHLSLHHSIEDATALTAEHLELLKSIDQAEALWMDSNKPSNSNQRNTN